MPSARPASRRESGRTCCLPATHRYLAAELSRARQPPTGVSSDARPVFSFGAGDARSPQQSSTPPTAPVQRVVGAATPRERARARQIQLLDLRLSAPSSSAALERSAAERPRATYRRGSATSSSAASESSRTSPPIAAGGGAEHARRLRAAGAALQDGSTSRTCSPTVTITDSASTWIDQAWTRGGSSSECRHGSAHSASTCAGADRRARSPSTPRSARGARQRLPSPDGLGRAREPARRSSEQAAIRRRSRSAPLLYGDAEVGRRLRRRRQAIAANFLAQQAAKEDDDQRQRACQHGHWLVRQSRWGGAWTAAGYESSRTTSPAARSQFRAGEQVDKEVRRVDRRGRVRAIVTPGLEVQDHGGPGLAIGARADAGTQKRLTLAPSTAAVARREDRRPPASELGRRTIG